MRLAGSGDWEAMRAVYGAYMGSSVTFEVELPSREAFQARMERMAASHPALAAEEGGELLGYAYAHAPWERAAYAWNAELTVYLRPDARGKGLGSALYGALLELLALQGARVALGVVALPNPASEALHKSLGFREAARFVRAGFKAGAWRDVVWFSKLLRSGDEAPSPLLRPDELDQAEVEAILERASLKLRSGGPSRAPSFL